MSFYLQLVTEKEVNNPSSMDVQRQLDSSGYLSVAPAGNEVSDSNSPESNTQSFLSYLQDHANTGTSVVAGKKKRARNLYTYLRTKQETFPILLLGLAFFLGSVLRHNCHILIIVYL